MRTNVEFLKLIDPLGQSLLFILFGYSLDSGISYHMVLLMLACWQLLSWAIHFFIKSFKVLKNERFFYIISSLVYLLVYVYITKKVKENYIAVRDPQGLTQYPLHEIILVSIGLIIAFWYYVICFREVKVLFKKNTH